MFIEKYDTGIAPAFVVPIKPKAVKPTETVELSCVVSGTPMPTVVWCRGDEQIVPDDSHVISYLPETGESKLTICKATELDVNDYTVKAVNTFGAAQCKANLIIGNYYITNKYSDLIVEKKYNIYIYFKINTFHIILFILTVFLLSCS